MDRRSRPSSVLPRSVAAGLAAGCRSTLGLVPVVASSSRRPAAALVTGLVLTELTADKLPTTPSRLAPGPGLGRLVLGAVGGATVARSRGAAVPGAALAGVVGAAVGALAGSGVRAMAAERGVTWPAAVAEDVVALGLVRWASRC